MTEVMAKSVALVILAGVFALPTAAAERVKFGAPVCEGRVVGDDRPVFSSAQDGSAYCRGVKPRELEVASVERKSRKPLRIPIVLGFFP